MNEQQISYLCRTLCAGTGRGKPIREPIRIWHLSGVERLRFPDRKTAVFKYAARPFTTEDRVLAAMAKSVVPVPAVLRARLTGSVLGMLLEDLGPTVREATDADGVAAGVLVHGARRFDELETVDTEHLQSLPQRCLALLDALTGQGRFEASKDIVEALGSLDRVAVPRSSGAEMPPFGPCHGELHPTSVHIGDSGLRLLDFAKSFIGPGLLDLASWLGTRQAPDLSRMRHLLDLYVAAGGHSVVMANRGGLPPEQWALGWHRVWAAHWYLRHSADGSLDPDDDRTHRQVIGRQLRAAAELLVDP